MAFVRYLQYFSPEETKKIRKMKLKMTASDFGGQIYITDLMLQGGRQVTAHVPHNSEMLKRVISTIDENDTAQGDDVYQDYLPSVYQSIENRFFNFIGRGHEVIVVPNVYHEDFTKYMMLTGLDITINAKNDYDLLRISSNFGTELSDFDKVYNGIVNEHPLHKRYTREFYFNGGSAGTEIKLHASTRTATVQGVPQPLGIRFFNVGNYNGEDIILKTPRQAFMVAPYGSYRIRIEFYKRVTKQITTQWGSVEEVELMEDAGIGFNGIVEFRQFELGGSKI